MSILKTIVPSRAIRAEFRWKNPEDRRQWRLMVGSLCILVLSLGILLWHDRDFWVPPDDADVDQGALTEIVPVAKTEASKAVRAPLVIAPLAATTHRAAATHEAATTHKNGRHSTKVSVPSPAAQAVSDDDSGITVTSRTVLPPLNVEVVAGDTHRVVQPGNNALHVDLQPDPPAAIPPQAEVETPETASAASVTNNAAERIQMSANTSAVVASEVRPNYPLLARQMKVQGRVILLALIGKDGIIQNLSLVSGPPILASAAEAAVRQWHFKPHLEGKEAVETQAKITVNFTISTN
ncbi:MAG TPA: energy transducer TonB [Candidatus Sulfotelmatobacter sp.]